jgi:hypothetical protein
MCGVASGAPLDPEVIGAIRARVNRQYRSSMIRAEAVVRTLDHHSQPGQAPIPSNNFEHNPLKVRKQTFLPVDNFLIPPGRVGEWMTFFPPSSMEPLLLIRLQ